MKNGIFKNVNLTPNDLVKVKLTPEKDKIDPKWPYFRLFLKIQGLRSQKYCFAFITFLKSAFRII